MDKIEKNTNKIKMMNPIHRNKEQLIDAFTLFYGEKYREYITDRINKMVAVNIKDKNFFPFIQSLNFKNGKELIKEFQSFYFVFSWELGGTAAQYIPCMTQKDKVMGLFLYNNKLENAFLIHEANHYLSTHIIETKQEYFKYSLGIERDIVYYDRNTKDSQQEETYDEKRRWLNELINEWCSLIIATKYTPKKNYTNNTQIIYRDSLLFLHEIFNCLIIEIKDAYMNGNYDAIKHKLGEKQYNTLLECSLKIKDLCEDYIDYENEADEEYGRHKEIKQMPIGRLYKNLRTIYSCPVHRGTILEDIGNRKPNDKVKCPESFMNEFVNVFTKLQPIYQKVKQQKLDKIITVNQVLENNKDKSKTQKEIIE